MIKLIQGDCIEEMKKMDDNSVDCVITSPPYWVLRNYGIEPVIWDGVEGCEHKWGDKRKIPKITQWNTGGVFDPNNRKIVQEESCAGQFCQKCGAWRGSLGLEPTFELYIKHLCDIFDDIKRVLKKEGTCWVNVGDTYNGNKIGNDDKKNKAVNTNLFKKKKQDKVLEKSLCMIPQRFAIEMCNRGWILRNVIIWHKPNAMPSSAKDRFTVDFEYVYFFVKNGKYYFEQQFEDVKQCSIKRLDRAVSNKNKWINGVDGQTPHGLSQPRPNKKYKGGGMKGRDNNCAIYTHKFNGADYLVSPFDPKKVRNKRTVWNIPTASSPEAHFATYPPELVEPCMKAGCPKGGIVLDPFSGTGTTGVVAKQLGRQYIGIDISPKYNKMAQKRIKATQKPLLVI